MKEVSTDLQVSLSSDCTTIATCCKVVRADDQVFGFTDHDRDIEYDGVTYAATTAVIVSANETNAGLNVDDMEIQGILDSPSITERDLLAGVWDEAEISSFLIDWQNPDYGILKLRRGKLGNVRTTKSMHVSELRGLSQAIQQPIGRVTGPGCDATFGDSRCKLDVSQFRYSGTVDSALDNRIFTTTDIDLITNNQFAFGIIEWTSGLNAGVSMEIRAADSGTSQIQMFLPAPFPIQAGDTFIAQFGCNKSKEQCIQYGNIVNFRGFPYKPTVDSIIRGPEC